MRLSASESQFAHHPAIAATPGGRVCCLWEAGQVVAENTDHHLLVKWGDLTVAEDDDRFVPRGNAVYAYSLRGADREWVLPETLRGRDLDVFSLSAAGRAPAPAFRVAGDRIRIALPPRAPVRIVARTTGG